MADMLNNISWIWQNLSKFGVICEIEEGDADDGFGDFNKGLSVPLTTHAWMMDM